MLEAGKSHVQQADRQKCRSLYGQCAHKEQGVKVPSWRPLGDLQYSKEVSNEAKPSQVRIWSLFKKTPQFHSLLMRD